MKKNLMSLAVATTVASGAAFAGQHVSPDGTGQVLLFPMYNADNGNATNMHIVNTTTGVKAVKIRFMEYKNSDEVLDFNVYLSKNDHFAFGVIKDPNGNGAAVITTDNSCTVPALGSSNGAFSGTATTNADGSVTRIQPFVNYQYANSFDVDSSIERTLTGHVEVIEMGVVSNVTGNGAAADATTAYATFATHGATGVPANCAGLDKAWASGTWKGTPGSGLTAPTGGLYGLAYHINVEAAAAFGFEPTAIDDWQTAQQHTDPGNLLPSVTGGQAKAAIYTNIANTDVHKMVTFANGQDAINATLMTQSLSNDVMINPAIGGQTDWVVSFPTKRQSVDKALKASVIPPFTDNWVGSTGTTTKKEDPACEPVSIGQSDRGEAFTANTNAFSPQPAAVTTSICNEVAIVAMGAAGTASALSASTGVTNLSFPYSEGWQSFTFNATGQVLDLVGANNQGEGLIGLPAIGFAAFKVNNGAMSYGNAAEHKTNTAYSGTIIDAE